MSFLDEIRKQPQHVREIMFTLCVVTTISIVGLIWFRSFEEDLFVLMNPEPEKQAKFYAERESRTPIIYATITEALGGLRANLYEALGFLEDYTANEIGVGEELKGEAYKLPLSGDK